MKFPFHKKDWINLGRWVQPPISGAFWCYWNQTESTKEAVGISSFEPMLFLDGYTLLKKSDQRKINQFVAAICKKRMVKKFIDHFANVGNRYVQRHLRVVPQGNHDLVTKLTTLFETYKELVGLWSLSIFLGDGIQKYILDHRLATEEDMIEGQKFGKRTWLEQQSAEIRRFAQQWKLALPSQKRISFRLLKDRQKFLSKLERHVEKYRWYGTHHWLGGAYNLKKCLNDINTELQRGTIIHSSSRPNKTPSEVIRFLNLCTYWRTHYAEVTVKVVFLSRGTLAKAAKRLGLSYDDFVLLSAKEIIELIKLSKRMLPANMKERKRAYGCFVEQGRETILVGATLKRAIKQIIDQEVGQVNYIKGIVACQGEKIIGKVRKIIAPEDIKTFKKGEVLIASETTPDFVPCMKVASAIITERGGITSHAAVVSRELNIPCIIGTKIATKVFKDGDMVEVDATKGIVRKIK